MQPEWNLKLIRVLDTANNTLILTWLVHALLSNKLALTKLQSMNTPAAAQADRRSILELVGAFLQTFNPEHQ